MIDLHTHSIFSDGELVPSELARRAVVKGYRAVAITDHVDHSNFDFIIPRIIEVCGRISAHGSIVALPGIEITHIEPGDIKKLAKDARKLGAKIVVVHGETIIEPVIPGTNRAAIESPIDILAHPGLITEEEVRLAAENSVFLEISTRKGHCLTNGYVAMLARKCKAQLVLNTDSHSPDDLTDRHMARKIAAGAGLSDDEIDTMFKNSEYLVEKSK
ncbi:MAG: histidinol phosphate phosphatase domain-containing protein [Thermodesulfobacteriota bacterium]|nr:histidinol phosphate phosphatase domain-containing protein [Thermodesulfobacteriota bacterium]